MKLILSLFLVFLSIAAGFPARGSQPAPQPIMVSFEIYRVLGNIDGDTSLTDDIWEGKTPKNEGAKAFSFFTICKLSDVGGHKLTVDDKGWHWDPPVRRTEESGKAPSNDKVMLITSPKLVLNSGETAAISLGSDQALEYFAAKGQGLYELKKMQTPAIGLSIKTLAQKESNGRIHLENMTITSRLVETRKPLEGTTLNVGEPVVSIREYKADIHLKPAKDYGFILLTSDGQGMLLVRLRVENMPAEKKN